MDIIHVNNYLSLNRTFSTVNKRNKCTRLHVFIWLNAIWKALWNIFSETTAPPAVVFLSGSGLSRQTLYAQLSIHLSVNLQPWVKTLCRNPHSFQCKYGGSYTVILGTIASEFLTNPTRPAIYALENYAEWRLKICRHCSCCQKQCFPVSFRTGLIYKHD